ncbi:MAG: FAA hydrolase family protein [Betaproteobacteria bacterium]|nr:MAG: FAA hydrolase family protein [Betaproteobacteria bacterium]
MKLATLRDGSRDGELVVVSRDLRSMLRAGAVAHTLQGALDRWSDAAPRLASLYDALNKGKAPGIEPFDPRQAMSPLPRAYQWCDGSVFVAHMERMSKWRNLPVPEDFTKSPYMYQGASDGFLGPMEDVPAVSEEWGIDYEAEVAVVTDAVSYGCNAREGGQHIALVMLCNDVSLRNLIPPELAKGFGFVQSKPASSFSPVAVTPDELRGAWQDFRLHLPLRSYVNGTLFGDPDAGAMVFGFHELMAHVAKTRSLTPGSIIGSGTVASRDDSRGTSCVIERRVKEILAHGEPRTAFLKFGDRVRIEMLDASGASVFGAIDQKITRVA